ncbi:MAG: hypothetical protein ACTSVC_01485 [Promethearchaeota archaeon]
MSKNLQHELRDILTYLIINQNVLEVEFTKKFPNGKNELAKNAKLIESLGFSFFRAKDEKDNWHIVFGLNKSDELPPNIDIEDVAILLLSAYLIYQQKEEKILKSELFSVFENFHDSLVRLLEDLKWLSLFKNYIYISPVGKFILRDFIRKPKKDSPNSELPLVKMINEFLKD